MFCCKKFLVFRIYNCVCKFDKNKNKDDNNNNNNNNIKNTQAVFLRYTFKMCCYIFCNGFIASSDESNCSPALRKFLWTLANDSVINNKKREPEPDTFR